MTVLEEHQNSGDDPQQVEDSAKHGQLLLVICKVDRAIAAFESSKALLLTRDNQRDEDDPSDDGQQDGNVETALSAKDAHIGQEQCQTKNRSDCR